MANSTMSRRRITLAMVAAAAEVSRTAAYHVLHPGKKTNIGVSAVTREKITAAAAKLGYVADSSARTLVSGRSNMVGLLMASPDLPFTQHLVELHRDLYWQHGYTTQVEFHYNRPELERERLLALLSRNADCLFISRSGLQTNLDLLEKFTERGSPVVVLGEERVHPQFCHLAFDEEQGMRLLVEHLQQRGWSEIGFLGYGQGGLNWPSQMRLNHLKAALADYPQIKLFAAEAVEDYAGCVRVLRQWYPGTQDTGRAVVAFHDHLAGVVLHILQKLLLRVPEQAAVAGIDGLGDPFLPLSLTSVCLPLAQHAQACWQMFDSILQGAEYPSAECVYIAPTLQAGQTT